jgi:hypothetical protein
MYIFVRRAGPCLETCLFGKCALQIFLGSTRTIAGSELPRRRPHGRNRPIVMMRLAPGAVPTSVEPALFLPAPHVWRRTGSTTPKNALTARFAGS